MNLKFVRKKILKSLFSSVGWSLTDVKNQIILSISYHKVRNYGFNKIFFVIMMYFLIISM